MRHKNMSVPGLYSGVQLARKAGLSPNSIHTFRDRLHLGFRLEGCRDWLYTDQDLADLMEQKKRGRGRPLKK